MRWIFPALIALLLGLATTAQAQSTSPWTWTDYGPALRSVSCANGATCVAVGQRGVALRSTAATGVSGPLAWSGAGLTYPQELASVSCTPAFCVAVSTDRVTPTTFKSRVYRSTDGGATWPTSVALPVASVPTKGAAVSTQSAMAVDCNKDGTAVCYAVGPTGGVWTSSDQGASWTALKLKDVGGQFRKIDCPAAGACVAISGSDTVVSTAVITDDAVNVVPAPKPFTGSTAVGCDQPQRCIVTDKAGHWVPITLPSGKWGDVDTFPVKDKIATPALDLSCAAPNTCVAVAGAGIVMRTTTLGTGAHGGWQRQPDGDTIPFNLTNVSCASSACVIAGKAANWLASENAGRTWNFVNRIETLKAIDCPAAAPGTCVAGGNGISVTNTSGELWSAPLVDADLDTKWIGCTGPTTCMQLGRTGGVTTTDLRVFDGLFPPTFSPAGISSGTCVSREICVALAKTTLTTLNGSSSAWGQSAFLPGIPGGITCLPGSTNPLTCLATVDSYVAVGTMTIQGDAPSQKARWNWEFTDVDAEAPLPAIACSPGPQITCTAAGGTGQVWSTDDPTFMHWTSHPLKTDEIADDRPALTSATCPASGYCLVAGSHAGSAYIASTTDNWLNYTDDSIDGIESASPTINAMTCPTLNRCIAVGDTALVGVRNAPIS